MVLIRRILFALLFIIEAATFSIPYMGDILDATREPVRSDIVICLGGGTVERLDRSIALLEEGYVSQHKLVLVGESNYHQPYLKKHYPNLELVVDQMPRNTAEEIRWIKEYMVRSGYTKALIVTDPPHSARAGLLSSLISVEGDESLKLRMVSSNVKWWDKGRYYQNDRANSFVWTENLAILYSMLVYGVMERVGLQYSFEHWARQID